MLIQRAASITVYKGKARLVYHKSLVEHLFYSPAAFRNASFIRDCQPGPLSRNFATTSGSRRSVTCCFARAPFGGRPGRSEEHTSELQSLMRISYAVFCLKKKKTLAHKKLIESPNLHI